MRLPAEWEKQGGVQLTWPDDTTCGRIAQNAVVLAFFKTYLQKFQIKVVEMYCA